MFTCARPVRAIYAPQGLRDTPTTATAEAGRSHATRNCSLTHRVTRTVRTRMCFADCTLEPLASATKAALARPLALILIPLVVDQPLLRRLPTSVAVRTWWRCHNRNDTARRRVNSHGDDDPNAICFHLVRPSYNGRTRHLRCPPTNSASGGPALPCRSKRNGWWPA